MIQMNDNEQEIRKLGEKNLGQGKMLREELLFEATTPRSSRVFVMGTVPLLGSCILPKPIAKVTLSRARWKAV